MSKPLWALVVFRVDDDCAIDKIISPFYSKEEAEAYSRAIKEQVPRQVYPLEEVNLKRLIDYIKGDSDVIPL